MIMVSAQMVSFVSFACLGAMLLIVLRSMYAQFRQVNQRLDRIEVILNNPLGEPED